MPHYEKGACWLSPNEHPCHSGINAPPVGEAAVPPRISPKGQALGSRKGREREGKGVREFPDKKESSTAALTFLSPTFLGHCGCLYQLLIL